MKVSRKSPIVLVQLTNRFHVAVCLFSKRSQMTSKCGKNKNVAHETIAECVTDILTPVFSDLLLTYARQHGLYLFYILKKQLVHIKEVVKQRINSEV